MFIECLVALMGGAEMLCLTSLSEIVLGVTNRYDFHMFNSKMIQHKYY